MSVTGTTEGRTGRRGEPAWQAAYCEFFVARERSLMRTAYAILGSWPAAEDATQATLTEMYVRWPRIRAGGVDAYARRTLVNTCLAVLRRRRREVVVDELPERGVGADDPCDRVDLVVALRTLSPRDRAVLALRFLDDLSVGETADVLDVAPGTVKSQTSRALARLDAALAAAPPTPTDLPTPTP